MIRQAIHPRTGLVFISWSAACIRSRHGLVGPRSLQEKLSVLGKKATGHDKVHWIELASFFSLNLGKKDSGPKFI